MLVKRPRSTVTGCVFAELQPHSHMVGDPGVLSYKASHTTTYMQVVRCHEHISNVIKTTAKPQQLPDATSGDFFI